MKSSKLHNITFTLGDPNGDGHGHYIVFHMQSNYSVKDITDAYNKATEILGFDFIKTCCVEYVDRCIKTYIPQYQLNII